jgi:short subunit dehydrogenase-like uncharacterized protein
MYLEAIMREFQIIIYGSYGFTGRLIAEECKSKNLSVLLAGRNEQKLKSQATKIGYPYKTVDVNDHQALTSILKTATLVIHCGGPFQNTAERMLNACLEAMTHYTDITGEYSVFERLASLDQQGKDSGIMIMPGTGFDVVPSDCLAVHLKKSLPTATHLQLAFTMSKGGFSRGTSKTMVEGMGEGGMIRQNGKLVSIPLGDKVIEVDFGPFRSKALCIPWGDISTAWRSTGIPNIEVYSGVPTNTIRIAKLSRWINFILKNRSVKNFLLTKIDARSDGPKEEKLREGKSFLWGRVRDNSGNLMEARLETASGYLLTARTSVYIATELLNGDVKPGYFTPAQYFGEDLITNIEGTTFTKNVLS